MANQDLLKELRDIHLPEPISAWPPAPGWWVLLGLLAMIILSLAIILWRHHRRNRFKRYALKELEQLIATYQKDNQPQPFFMGMSSLLRRFMMVVHGRKASAGLSGQQWLLFLGEDFKAFEHELLNAPYCQTTTSDPLVLATKIKLLFKHSRGVHV